MPRTVWRLQPQRRKLPALPVLEIKAEWPKFWDIIQHYLHTSTYDIGLGLTIRHDNLGTDYDNAAISARIDDILLSKLDEDAKVLVMGRGKKYTVHGFDKLTMPRKEFDQLVQRG